MGIYRALALAAAVAAMAWGTLATASGPSPTAPWYVDQYGGDPADVDAVYSGRLGIVLPTAPRPILYVDWRLLHGQAVGETAGKALTSPCCGAPWWTYDWKAGANAWLEARKLVPGASELLYVDTDRPNADNSSSAVCFDDAFDTAAATLKARAAAHGADSSEIKAWLATQDAVFANCKQSTPLPPTLAGASAWLRSDRAYQEAAAAFYDGRYDEAAERFTRIAQDPVSPWQGTGVYLSVRALTGKAIADNSPSGYVTARAALRRLEDMPPGTFGRTQLEGLRNRLDIHEDPKGFAARLEQRLAPHEPPATIAPDFRDLSDLADDGKTTWEALDWMATLKASPPPEPARSDLEEEPTARTVARYEAARRSALDHAVSRWREARDPAWLIAALSLASPGDAQASSLLASARAAPFGSPAWLTLQHHVVRLTKSSSPPAATRRLLDDILLRPSLSTSDRNVFEGQRTQVSSDLGDFLRHATRRRLCPHLNEQSDQGPWVATCVRELWDPGEVQPRGLYDGQDSHGSIGFGEDARAIIDRAPLASRIALSQDRRLPAALRLDLALTSYGRAVQLQDDDAIDALSNELSQLLPLMTAEFRDVRAARRGADKHFAEFLVLAKIPGVRTDLPGYTRPAGSSVAAFQGYWTDWLIIPHPVTAAPPPLAVYQVTGARPISDASTPWPDTLTDLACLGECGRGAAPLRLPAFLDDRKARAERAFFFSAEHAYNQPPPTPPPGAIDAWDEMLDYIRAHPADPRAPEALHWLVHVGHFGGSHDHSGRRAFHLLHERYENSDWAKKTPYYND